MFSSSSVVDGSLPSTAGELHPRLQDSQCHPLILDGLSRLHLTPCGTRLLETLCLHVLSSFQRTGCLVVRALALGPGRDHVPHQLYFLEGNLAILQSVHLSVNPFLVAASIFFEALSRGPHRMQAKFPPCPVGLRARGATWECELKEVLRLRADALRRNGSRSVQPIYAARPGLSTQATARIVSSSKPA